MTTLRLFAQIGKNAGTSVFQQIAQLQKIACTPSCWKSRRNDSSSEICNSYVCQSLPLWRKQTLVESNHIKIIDQRRYISNKSSPDHAGKTESKSSAAITNEDLFGETSKLSLFAKFKLMYKKYWYVLIPVHLVTSFGWFAGFYYLSQSGVDIPALLQYLHISDTIIDRVKNSSMGHLAIAYLFYKVATPLRYAVTLGGTTVSIKYLVQTGYIKPVPTKQEFMDMYEQKKADLSAKEKKK